MICLSCTGKTIETDLELIEQNREYIDLAEIRADFLEASELVKLEQLPGKAGLPCILTFRKPADGGVNPDVGVEQRAAILTAALGGGWSYIDIEEDADSESERELLKTAHSAGVRVIKSFHDFNGVPERLAERLLAISAGDRYIPKAAVMIRSTADLLAVFDAHRELRRLRESSDGFSCTNGPFLSDYILVGMGSAGVPSRIMAGAWGSMLSFTSAGQAAAPGHIGPREMAVDYNYPNLTADTAVLGIVGNPVLHTKSPSLHNAALQAAGLDEVYLPFETAEPELLLERAGELGLRGLSVTVPHKKHVIEFADETDQSVSAIGACNTLVRSAENGHWTAYNTDWLGFLAPLKRLSAEGFELKGCRTLVIGAGGAARAVVYALAGSGAEVVIVNRTAEKARALADDFGCTGGGFELCAAGERHFGLVVQTTSVGMEPAEDGNPVPGFDFSGVGIAYDLIYAPEKTRFLSEAEKAGCRIINGFPMLRAQAAEQFRLFTGRDMNQARG